MGRRLPRALSLLAVFVFVTMVGSEARAANPPGDPPGNNGTIKTKKADPAQDPNEKNNNNQPHINGCIVWLSYTGFDAGQTADITFTAQAPSGKGEVVLADTGVAVSPDAVDGGQDQDRVISYNLSSAVQSLKRQPQQGYHLKVASDVKDVPGGAKQKVFWLNCAPGPLTKLKISKAITGTRPGTDPFEFSLTCNHRPLDTTFTLQGGEAKTFDVPAGTTCVAAETDKKDAADPPTIAENPATDGTADGKVTVPGNTPTTVTFTNIFPGDGGTPPPDDTDIRNEQGGPAGTDLPAGGGTTGGTTGEPGTEVAGTTEENPGNEVLGGTATRPETIGTLPRTGGDPRPLTAGGLWALGAGGLALTAARWLRPRSRSWYRQHP